MEFSTPKILRLSIVFVALALATVLIISIRQSQRVRDTAETVSGTEELLHHIQAMVLAIVNNEAASRGYVITGKEEYLVQVRQSAQKSHYELTLLKEKLADRPAQHLLYDSLYPYINKRISFSNQAVSVREQQGYEPASQLIMTGAGKFYVDEIQRIADKMTRYETELLELRKKSNDHTISQLSILLYFILAAAFILSLLIIRRVYRNIDSINQRRIKEEELRKSEERFRLLVNNVKDYAIFLIDTAGKVTSWNSGAEYIKGYSAEEIIGKPIDIFYTPDDLRHGEPGQNLQIAREFGHYEHEGCRVRKDGSVFWANVVISALFDDNGDLQGYVKITRDITERKKNEEQLLFLSHQINRSNDAIYMIGVDRTIKSWNRGAEILYGFTKEEAMGKDSNQLLQTAITAEEIQAALKQLAEHGYWAGELKRKKKSGEDIHLRSSNTCIRNEDGSVMGYIVVNLDITEQKRLEDKLKKFNEDLEEQVRLKTAELIASFERVTDGFIALDKDFRYRYVNKRAAKMIQRDPASMLGKKAVDEYPYIIETQLYAGFREAMSSQQPVVITERYETLDRYLENYIYPSPDGLSIFIRDITDKKKTEQELKTAHERLLFHVENAPLGFIEWDNELRVKSWSKRAEEIFGWTEKELIVMQQESSGVVNQNIPDLKLIARQLLNGNAERNIIEFRNNAKDGRVVWCEWFNSVIKDANGKVITILSLVQDITDRKKAEVEIRRNYVEKRSLAERMSTILNTVPANIALLDEQGIIADLNDAWKNFDNCSGLIDKDHRIGTDYLAVVLASTEPDGKILAKGILGVLSGRLKEFTFEYSYQSAAGKKWFRMIVTPLQQSQQAGAVIMYIDITVQKLNEEALRLSYEEIRRLASHLQHVREEERKSMSREIHDQLGQQLAVIKMDVSWLYKKMSHAEKAVRDKMEGLRDLTDDTVNLVRRISADLRPGLLDDMGILAAIEWHLEEFGKRAGIKTKLSGLEEEPELSPEAKSNLFRIVQESLTNVSRHAKAKKVAINIEARDGFLVLEIKDDGVGFDKEKIVQKRTLGLLGMHERIAMLKGSYEIDTAPGKGTVVLITIPV